MIALLQAIGHRRPGWAYVHELLDIHARNDGRDRHRPAGSPVRGGPGIVERLSGRELEVLHLLATDLAGPDIARRLVVSINTLHTHTKSIYAKLGVSGRRAAVRQAEELDLIPRGR